MLAGKGQDEELPLIIIQEVLQTNALRQATLGLTTQLTQMLASGCFVVFLVSFCSFSSSFALTDAEAAFIARRQLLGDNEELSNTLEEMTVNLKFENDRLKKAYIGLQAWKKAVYSDPFKFTANWEGADVCAYKGVFCDQALDDPTITVVAGIDLNHADIAGHLPVEIGHLVDVSLIHLNSNRFCGIIPRSIKNLLLLDEADFSNNRFVGPFPDVLLELPKLKYLDLRFNNFEGQVPSGLFDKNLDAIFLNDNRFHSIIPENFGNSNASVVVLANNRFYGCIPKSIGKMGNTLDELIVTNNELSGCLPEEISKLLHGKCSKEPLYLAQIGQFHILKELLREHG
ncbi:Pollen-specific leucine-rich repeat extensin-like protein 2 [Capsicum annuum]|uniref:Cell wall hydroxyproline-rich glycoprotein n=1 Tax=Capsicum annuum TaxID=4072 RepID=A0A2G2Y3U5_CAPAN|nr:Pollen-specific leucine-rich repeat extensin-like protein 2 [Capsicum annuum]